MANAPPKIDVTKHPDFKVIHANGVFGTLNAQEGVLKFYTDIIEPRSKTGARAQVDQQLDSMKEHGTLVLIRWIYS